MKTAPTSNPVGPWRDAAQLLSVPAMTTFVRFVKQAINKKQQHSVI